MSPTGRPLPRATTCRGQSSMRPRPAPTTRPHARPSVYATLGTVYNSPGLLTAILEALAGEPLDLIVTVGPNQDPDQFGPQPANAHSHDGSLTPRRWRKCDAVVNHGGYGTVTAAFARAPDGAPADLRRSACRRTTRGASRASASCSRPTSGLPRSRSVPPDRGMVLDDPTYRAAAERVRRHADQRPASTTPWT